MKNRKTFLFVLICLVIGISCSFGFFSMLRTTGENQPVIIKSDKKKSSLSITANQPPENDPARPYISKTRSKKLSPHPEEEFPHIENDSRAYDSLLAIMNKEEMREIENDPVLSDEMIAIKEVALVNKTAHKKVSLTDTVIASKINLKEDEVPPAYTLEIWKSPLNSFGYRLGKNKLALYGINPQTDLLLYQLDEGMYLKSGKLYYLIEKSSEFRNLRPVNDAAVIRKIEN